MSRVGMPTAYKLLPTSLDPTHGGTKVLLKSFYQNLTP